MSSNAIEIHNVSKLYRLGEVGTGTLSHDLNRWWHKIRGKEDPYMKLGQENKRDSAGSQYVWAINDVSFNVPQGSVFGIIGKNGAGKSTLLKILSRVTAPTKGTIRAKGRIASLLEVGTGFHPELTGRENIFLNGAILGMTKQEIKRKFDEIVDFAGVSRYIDTPVKRYSSGMYVRLAFGVAAHLESEILIVDEVLAVGDAEFQNKCLGKMSEVSKGEGRTVLFVSHNMGAVKSLCNGAVLMQRGTVSKIGATSDIIEDYLSSDSEVERFKQWHENHPGDRTVQLDKIQILDRKNSLDLTLVSSDVVTVEVYYTLTEEVKDLRVVVNILTFDGTEVFSTSDFRYQDQSRVRKAGKYKSSFTIPGNFLTVSRYFVSVDIDIPMTKAFVLNQTVAFSIDELVTNDLGMTIARKPSGVIHPILPWNVEKIG
ncbi:MULTISPECIES: ABC transporter ATP-binding protein [unclassified Paraflavitalea]|uniref:ABC transporter ATP-binding protein n=1 Tax=unclassified Paraflavitalea TaxID=2798305 RepID=UPI003D350519